MVKFYTEGKRNILQDAECQQKQRQTNDSWMHILLSVFPISHIILKMLQNVVFAVNFYVLGHREGRVLSFFSSRWDYPWGEGHTRWWERGWESPNSDEGTDTVVHIKYTYCTLCSRWSKFYKNSVQWAALDWGRLEFQSMVPFFQIFNIYHLTLGTVSVFIMLLCTSGKG